MPVLVSEFAYICIAALNADNLNVPAVEVPATDVLFPSNVKFAEEETVLVPVKYETCPDVPEPVTAELNPSKERTVEELVGL